MSGLTLGVKICPLDIICHHTYILHSDLSALPWRCASDQLHFQYIRGRCCCKRVGSSSGTLLTKLFCHKSAPNVRIPVVAFTHVNPPCLYDICPLLALLAFWTHFWYIPIPRNKSNSDILDSITNRGFNLVPLTSFPDSSYSQRWSYHLIYSLSPLQTDKPSPFSSYVLTACLWTLAS